MEVKVRNDFDTGERRVEIKAGRGRRWVLTTDEASELCELLLSMQGQISPGEPDRRVQLCCGKVWSLDDAWNQKNCPTCGQEFRQLPCCLPEQLEGRVIQKLDWKALSELTSH